MDIRMLMKQAQEMQAKLEQAQQELANMQVTGESGGGMVKVTMTGKHDVREVEISPEVMDDREMLEALIAAAVNDAHNERPLYKERMIRCSIVTKDVFRLEFARQ